VDFLQKSGRAVMSRSTRAPTNVAVISIRTMRRRQPPTRIT
jgi:hypothetical protein